MHDVLIIGSGPLGMTLAVYLRRHGVPRTGIAILDPHAEPLAGWRRRAAAVGMSELRSPAGYHIDLAPSSLTAFAAATGRALAGTDRPPSLRLFEDHARHVIEETGLDSACIQGTARALAPFAHGWRIETAQGWLEAHAVVLALGSAQEGQWPPWARALARRGVPIAHVLESAEPFQPSERLAVVGSGLSAVQVAIAAARRGQAVTLFVKRHPQVVDYDFDRHWFADDAPSAFRSTWPMGRRLAALGRERHPGSIPPATARSLADWLGEGAGRIRVLPQPIERVSARGHGARFFLAEGSVDAEQVILATGFAPQLPGHRWLQRAARAQGLPLAPSGHPVLDPRLQWAPGLYATGALAELEVGPAARGLAGGRQAARLIAWHLCRR